MHIRVFKSLWEAVGFRGRPLTIHMPEHIEDYFRRIKEAGYDGVESPLPGEDQEARFRELLAEYGLAYIAQVLTVPDHADSFERQAKRASGFDPVLIVSQSAKDDMPLPQQIDYFRRAARVEREIGIPVAHETHRGRALFTPWHTAQLLREVPELMLNADFSHWCCVCESLLDEREEELALACSRSLHIHGRVGYAEGPQVPDPRAPEYDREWQAHLAWWEAIVRHRMRAGAPFVTFTPEFGPPGYMHTLPYTKQPVADVWELNRWTAEAFKAHMRQLGLA